MRLSYEIISMLLVTRIQAWIMDESCHKYENFLTDSMKTAFQWTHDALDNLRELAAGGDPFDPKYEARLDLFQYIFSGAFDMGNTVINPNYPVFQTIEGVFQDILNFDKNGDGSPSPRPIDRELPTDDFIVYCDYERLRIGRTCDGYIDEESACDTDTYSTMSWTERASRCINEDHVLYGDETELAWASCKYPMLISTMQLCTYLLEETYTSSFELEDIFNQCALLARDSEGARALLPDEGEDYVEVEIVALYAPGTLVHEMSHMAFRYQPTDVAGEDSYGWVPVLKFSPFGPDSDDEPSGHMNADNYAYFAIGSALIQAEVPQRVNMDGTISLIYPDPTPNSDRVKTRREHLGNVTDSWRSRRARSMATNSSLSREFSSGAIQPSRRESVASESASRIVLDNDPVPTPGTRVESGRNPSSMAAPNIIPSPSYPKGESTAGLSASHFIPKPSPWLTSVSAVPAGIERPYSIAAPMPGTSLSSSEERNAVYPSTSGLKPSKSLPPLESASVVPIKSQKSFTQDISSGHPILTPVTTSLSSDERTTHSSGSQVKSLNSSPPSEPAPTTPPEAYKSSSKAVPNDYTSTADTSSPHAKATSTVDPPTSHLRSSSIPKSPPLKPESAKPAQTSMERDSTTSQLVPTSSHSMAVIIATTSSSTVTPSSTIIPVIKSGKTTSVVYTSTFTSSGSIGPTAVWKCTGPLCDQGGGCIIPIFCSVPGHHGGGGGGGGGSGGGIGLNWGLCCDWEPSVPNGNLPGGPSPGPAPQEHDDDPSKSDGSKKQTGTDMETKTSHSTTSSSSHSSTSTSHSSSSSTHSSTPTSSDRSTSSLSHSTSTSRHSSQSSCTHTTTGSSCSLTVTVFTPKGSSLATTSTITGKCTTTQGCQVTNAASTSTSTSDKKVAVYTPILEIRRDRNPAVISSIFAGISALEAKLGPSASRPGVHSSTKSATKATKTTTKSTTKTTKSTHHITSCSKTTDKANPTPYCKCNDGWIAGIGTTIGKDKFTTYTCEVGTSTVIPVSTVKPTDIPGVGGVPGCHAILAAPGTSAYCNCGGKAAPTLKPTSSGIMNCDYTTLPTKPYNPAIPPTKATATKPPTHTTTTAAAAHVPYATGKCNAHVAQGIGSHTDDPEVYIGINLTDAHGTLIGSKTTTADWNETLVTDSKLPWTFLLTAQAGTSDVQLCESYLCEKGDIDFAYGSQAWNSTSSQCSVGKWANANFGQWLNGVFGGHDHISTRQMDCKFDCPGS